MTTSDGRFIMPKDGESMRLSANSISPVNKSDLKSSLYSDENETVKAADQTSMESLMHARYAPGADRGSSKDYSR